ncbi:MAG: heme biosynthesis HemY N-terminal domain-containing protein [Gemmatimonas sp.]
MKTVRRLLKLAVFIAILAGLLFVAGWFGANPGSVSMVWRGYRYDLSVATTALIATALIVGAALITWLILLLLGVPGRIRAWREGRGRDRALATLSRGLTAVAAGDPQGARAAAKRIAALDPDLPLGLLLRAQAAQLAHDRIDAAAAFAAMMRHPETEFLGIRGMLLLASRGDAPPGTDPLMLAERASALKPDSGWVADTLFDLKVRNGAADEAETILKRAVRKGALTSGDAGRKRAALWLAKSDASAAEGAEAEALKLARRANDLAPEFAPGAVRVAALERRDGNERRARAALERAIGHHPHPELIAAYAELGGADEEPLKRVTRMERLLKLAPRSPEVRIGLADAAAAAGLWGVARDHLHAARDLYGGDAPSGLFRRFATLEVAEHGNRDAELQWLRQAAAARADEAWTCRACGAVAPRWTERCGACGTFDGLEWRSPGRVTTPVETPAEAAAIR